MSNRQKGIFCILASAFFFALMNVFVRLSGDLPSPEKSFFRNLVAFFVAGWILLKSGQGFHTDRSAVPLLLARSFFGTVGILGNFYAVDHMLLADASAIQKLVPFITIVASFVLLKEKIRPYQILCIAGAFLASLLVVKPGLEGANLPAALAAAAGAICAGIAYTLVRMLSMKQVAKAQIIFFFSAFSCLAMIPLMLFDFVWPSWNQLLYLLLAGAAASGGQFAVTYAYSFAPAREISVFDYSQILFSALLGFFVFSQVPDALSWLGYGGILLAGVLNFWLQSRTGKTRNASK